MERGRIAIVGGGIAGAATAWALAEGGETEVVLLEAETCPGAHSTAKNAAILRIWCPSPAATLLAEETAAFLAAPPAGFSPTQLLDPCGTVLAVADPPPASLTRWLSTRGAGAVERLDEARLAEVLPPFTGRAPQAFLLREEGRIDVAALLDGFLRGARRAGVEVRTAAPVAGVERRGARVGGVVLASGERLEAERVVLAAGAWAGALGRAAGSRVELHPTRRHLLVTEPDEGVDPSWPVLWSDPDGFYARPESGGWLLCACDQTQVDPDDWCADEGVRAGIAEKTARLLAPAAEAGAAHFWGGLRTFARDEELVIGPDPDVLGLDWVAALGGHGISSSVGAGRLAAALLMGRACDGALARAVSPARLAGPVVSGA
ncbi:MAG: FAD-dependent oxidoreductase [Planctomycetota bacterium]|jgi:D-arginine dehydrogenase|nr:FAD-dependent oxidoreductase [Planctomycetota bacterium]MDP6988643.1 FAD-dependent oxidoreductase [Planctomycetota bacterium]